MKLVGNLRNTLWEIEEVLCAAILKAVANIYETLIGIEEIQKKIENFKKLWEIEIKFVEQLRNIQKKKKCGKYFQM